MSATALKSIRRVPLGRGGPMVSALGFGAMGLSQSYGPIPSVAESVRVLNHAVDLGVTFIDTSNVYGAGENEKLIAHLLKDRRDEVFLCSKFGISGHSKDGALLVRGEPDYVRQCCEESLKRLGTDHIDLYFQHRVDPKTPIEDTVQAMATLVAEGKGLSESDMDPELIRRAHAVHPIAAVQVEYSIWTTEIETNGVLATCEELGIAVVAFSPLGRGFLAGAVRTQDALTEGDFRRVLPRFQAEALPKNLALLEELERLAAEKGCTVGQLSLAWLVHEGRTKTSIIPIPGTKRIETLSDAQVAELKRVFGEFDKDGDGVLSKADVAAVLRALGKDVTDAEAQSMVAEADEDDDDSIDFKEFLDMMSRSVRLTEYVKAMIAH
ncbi:hypothetical protein HK405_007320 [Cladochytrium tenue]|nr:hypothetical protein HK405_007320 [Cladochytrium tenue]